MCQVARILWRLLIFSLGRLNVVMQNRLAPFPSRSALLDAAVSFAGEQNECRSDGDYHQTDEHKPRCCGGSRRWHGSPDSTCRHLGNSYVVSSHSRLWSFQVHHRVLVQHWRYWVLVWKHPPWATVEIYSTLATCVRVHRRTHDLPTTCAPVQFISTGSAGMPAALLAVTKVRSFSPWWS